MLKNAAKRAARSLGYDITRRSPIAPEPSISDRAKTLIRAMWPVTTDHPLVRFGGTGDGAYLVPDDLDGIAALFSPGVAAVSQFEAEIAALGMRCFMADGSVDGPAENNPAFTFEKRFLGLVDDDTHMTIDHWVDAHEPGDHDLMLQMDIEGAEWTVLANLSDRLLKRFRVMVVEFHSMSLLFDPYAEQILIDVLQRLLTTHRVVHNHPNNAMWMNCRADVEIPEVMEVTFLRKDRAEERGYVAQFPHSLDVVSNPLKVNLVLPAMWHA